MPEATKPEKVGRLLRLSHKIARGDPYRQTRLHTERGERVPFKPGDALLALATTLTRRLGYHPPLPLWPADARRYLDQHVRGARVFEWGSGMSTVWLAKRARQVVSIEDNYEWFERLSRPLAKYPHVSVIFANRRTEYVSALVQPFDVVIVDGSWRQDCIERAAGWLLPGATIVVDDTDKGEKYSQLVATADRCFPDADRRRFAGFTHGCAVPHETTVLHLD